MSAERSRIAIFPLSNVVLFPRMQTPLHLFEPRYRQMAEHAIEQGSPIGMVTVPPEFAPEMEGDPPVYPVGCAGVVSRAQKLPDGRYNVVLTGAYRFRILRELPRSEDRLYRLAEVERLDEPFEAAERERVGALRQRIVELLAELVRLSGRRGSPPVSPELFRGVEDAVFVNILCGALGFGPVEKQGLLEAASVPQRFERLEGLLHFRLAELRSRAGAGSGRLH